MQKRRGQLGGMLVGLGLITPDDVERALAHQRESGGYFGDALVELGLLAPDQVRWALADQYDVPFVQIRPENIDRATAIAVPADWAREHLILPVLRDGDTVTVILADPGAVDRLDEVRRFTRAARVEPALSSAATIRELIDSVHGEGSDPPVQLGRWLGEVLTTGATLVGVSVRGERAQAWSRGDGDGIHFRTLADGWRDELSRALSSFPHVPRGEPRSWPAVLSANGASWRVECHAVGEGRALEWAARIVAPLPREFPRVRVDDEIASIIAGKGGKRNIAIRVLETDAVAPEVLDTLVAALPASLHNDHSRSIHFADQPIAVPPDTLFVPLDGPLEDALARLKVYALDALSLDVNTLARAEINTALWIAPLVIFRTRSVTSGPTADLNLALRVSGDEVVWTSYTAPDATD